jgi:hypothetical protein
MLTRTPHNCMASHEWQRRYAACPSVLTIPWRPFTVSQGRSAPA